MFLYVLSTHVDNFVCFCLQLLRVSSFFSYFVGAVYFFYQPPQLLKEVFNQQPSVWGTDKLPHTVVPAWFQRPGYVSMSLFTQWLVVVMDFVIVSHLLTKDPPTSAPNLRLFSQTAM